MDSPGWFPDELAHAGDEHLDHKYIEGYDHKAGYDPAADLELLCEFGLDQSSVFVDLGAGTGTLAVAVATHCRRVVAVDVSPAMVAAIRDKASEAGVANIEAMHAGFLSYEHQGDPADFVYSRNALHHLPDFWKAIALRRIAAMLKPGGVLVLHDLVYSFDPDDAVPTIEAWLANAVERPADGFTRPELETHLRTEYSTFSWLLEPMLEHAGFEIRQARHRPPRTYSAYVCAKR